jgi:hypothetical protein
MGLLSAILVFNTKDPQKPDLFLCIMWVFAFILFTGILGAPFLVYERYILMLCVVSALFAAPFIQEVYNSIEQNFRYEYLFYAVSIGLVVWTGINGIHFINQLTPFVTTEEVQFFSTVKHNIPINSTLLVSSRQHYWATSLSGMNVVPLEWYELIGTRPPSDEVSLLKVNPMQEQVIVSLIKAKYNVTNFYLAYNIQRDPVVPRDILEQQTFFQKIANWELVGNSTNVFLYKF